MRLSILHEIRYEYAGPVISNRNTCRISPIAGPLQSVFASRIETEPPGIFRPYTDAYGNLCNLIHVSPPHDRLLIRGVFEVERHPVEITGTTPEGVRLPDLPNYLFPFEFDEFLEGTKAADFSEEVWNEAEKWRAAEHRDVHDLCLEITRTIQRSFRFIPGVTTVHTTAAEVWRKKTGVCQDFAHAMVSLLRALGVPARYVSGYILSEGVMHAWVQAWVPGPGWVDYDPTHGRVVTPEYCAAAVGRDYADCAPIEGTYFGPRPVRSDFRVTVRVIDPPAVS